MQREQRRLNGEEKEPGYGPILLTLTRAGFSKPEIFGMTLDQLEYFYKAALENSRQEAAQELYLNALGSSQDTNSINKALEKLRGE